jgi:D-glycero-D-manno-heptose 1,7-bisphosphate phosphatase
MIIFEVLMKILFVDKDGTLVSPASGAKFTNRPWDQAALPGAHEAIARFVADGYKPIMVSNQGGVEKGYKSLESAIFEMQFALELFPGIIEAYFCPNFLSGDGCWRVWGDCSEENRIEYNPTSLDVIDLAIEGQFRKPGAGMLKLAIAIHDAENAIMVGDRPEDKEAAVAAAIPFIDAAVWRG